MAWYAQPEVYPTYSWAFQDWRNNGGMVTRNAFREALKQGVQPGEIASTVPMLFEDYWHFVKIGGDPATLLWTTCKGKI